MHDLLALCETLRGAHPGERPRLFVRFSFGALCKRRCRVLADNAVPAWRTCLLGVPFGEVDGGRSYDTPDGLPDALVVHGEHDQRVPLQSVLDWARPQGQPVVVVPGADH